MKIYVASSWRNPFQSDLVARLRSLNHEVYDFKNPNGDGPNTGFGWQQIDPDWKNWTLDQYKLALTHATAQKGFESDERAMIRAEACVLCMPAGNSAHIEMGWMLGRGQFGYVLLNQEQFQPDLMYLLTPLTRICTTEAELIQRIAEDDERMKRGELRPEYDFNTLRPTARSIREWVRHDNLNVDDLRPQGQPITYRSSSAKPNMSEVPRDKPVWQGPMMLYVKDHAVRVVATGETYTPALGQVTLTWLHDHDYVLCTGTAREAIVSNSKIGDDVAVYVHKRSGAHTVMQVANTMDAVVAEERKIGECSEIIIEGGLCNLPTPSKTPLLLHIAPAEPSGWAACSVTNGNVFDTDASRIDLEAKLVNAGYKLINPRLRERLHSCNKFSDGDVYIHAPMWQQAEENFEKIKNLLP